MDPNRIRSKPINNTIVVVPVFNEQERIEQVVASIKEMHNDLDILVVDDGSSDKTALFARFAGARVIRLSSNMGYGVALQTGYKYAFNEGYDYLIQLDGDGQHDPKYIPNMLELLKSGQVDLVLGSRFLNEATGDQRSISNYRQSLARKLGIWMFSFLVSKLVKFKVTDPTSGYQAINRSVIAFFIQDFFPCDFPDADVIVMVHRAGFIIKEYPMVMHQRESGKSMHWGLKPAYYVFKMFLSLFMTLLRKSPPVESLQI